MSDSVPFTDTQQQLVEHVVAEALAKTAQGRWVIWVAAGVIALFGGGGGIIGGVTASNTSSSARETALVTAEQVKELRMDIAELKASVATRDTVDKLSEEDDRMRIRMRNMEVAIADLRQRLATVEAVTGNNR